MKLIPIVLAITSILSADMKDIIDSQFCYSDSSICSEMLEMVRNSVGSEKKLEECTEDFYQKYYSDEVQGELENLLRRRFTQKEIEEIGQLTSHPLFQKYKCELHQFAREAWPIFGQLIRNAVGEPAPEKPPGPTKVIEARPDTITKLISSNKRVVVDVYSSTCPPCKKLAPILDELSLDDNYVFVKVSAEKNFDFMQKHEVRAFPTLLFFKDGQKVGTHVGFIIKDKLFEMLAKSFN